MKNESGENRQRKDNSIQLCQQNNDNYHHNNTKSSNNNSNIIMGQFLEYVPTLQNAQVQIALQ